MLSNTFKIHGGRLLSLLMVLMLLLGMLSGCGDSKPKETPQTPSQNAVAVSSIKEFLEAIEPGAEIFFKAGTYDINEALNEIDDLDALDEAHPYFSLIFESESWTINIQDVQGLYISGEGTSLVELINKDPYARVLAFNNCTNIYIDHMTMGHGEQKGNCAGSVLGFDVCSGIELDALDLYGCGTYGIEAYHCAGLSMKNSTIRDCSEGIISSSYTAHRSFEGCSFKNCEGYTSLNCYRSELLFENCSFKDNGSNAQAEFIPKGFGSSIYFRGCEFSEWESAQLDSLYDHGVIFDENCKFAKSMSRQPVIVDSAEGLFNAINEAPMAVGAMIILEPGYYDLTEYINSIDTEDYNSSHSYVQFEYVFDGYEPVIYSQFFGITSRSGRDGETTIVVEPRYANVLTGYSSNISLRGITIGHTELGECSGGVIYIKEGGSLIAADCDIYGCGTIGIRANDAGIISVLNCNIHDCSDQSFEIDGAYEELAFVCSNLDGGGCTLRNADDVDVVFSNDSFGEWESNWLYFDDHPYFINCDFHEITYYPDIMPDVDPGMDFRYSLQAQPFDGGVLVGTWGAVWYEDPSEDVDEAMPSYDPDTGEMFQLTMYVAPDGTLDIYETGDDVPWTLDWNMESDYSAAISNPGEEPIGNIGIYADTSEEGEHPVYLLMSVKGAIIWFQHAELSL